jgi:hypothetical protein
VQSIKKNKTKTGRKTIITQFIVETIRILRLGEEESSWPTLRKSFFLPENYIKRPTVPLEKWRIELRNTSCINLLTGLPVL